MSLFARLSRSALTLAVVLAPLGCGADAAVTQALKFETGPNGIQAGWVKVLMNPTAITIDNQTERPIYVMTANAETLALMDWAPCTGGTNCPPLAQGQKRDIPYTAALAYEASTKQYTVYWWNVTVQPDGTARAENMNHVTLTR